MRCKLTDATLRLNVGLAIEQVMVTTSLRAFLYLAFSSTSLLLAQASSVTVVSSATYQPVVAPGSLATAFGSGFLAGSSGTTFAPRVDLPTSLDGVSVDVNGIAAPIVFVSSTQINFVIPANAPLGSVPVIIKAGTTQFATSAAIQQTAPGIFADGSAAAVGAILNAVTLTPGPFSVLTPELPSTDKRTRLAVYATGVRYAAAAPGAGEPGNAASSVQATILQDNGQNWPLAVEYSGPAPGFAGVDQINVVLPAQLDGAGRVFLRVSVGAASSNTVTLEIRYALPPAITAVQPPSVPPNGTLTVSGDRFATLDQLGASRVGVIVVLPDGREFPASATSASRDKLETWVPAITDEKLTLYGGSATICVQNDAGRDCSKGLFTIATPATALDPPGTNVLAAANQEFQTALATIRDVSPDAVANAQSAGEAAIQQLTAIIQSARDGHPQSVSFANSDGSVSTSLFDVTLLRLFDSLLAAQPALISTSGFSSLARTPRDTSACTLPGEASLSAIREDYEKNEQLSQGIERAAWGVVVGAAIVGCVNGAVATTLETVGLATIPACLAGAAAAAGPAELLTKVATAPPLAALFVAKFLTEAGPNFLNSIDSPSVEVGVDQDQEFDINGQFTANFKGGITDLISKQFVKDALKALGPALIPGEAGEKLTESLVEPILGPILEEIANLAFSGLPANPTRNVVLGQSSLSVAIPSDSADLTLACASDPTKVHGVKATAPDPTFIGLSANTSAFLRISDAPIYPSVKVVVDASTLTTYTPDSEPNFTIPETFVHTVPQAQTETVDEPEGNQPGSYTFYALGKDTAKFNQILHDAFTCSNCDDPQKIKWVFEGSGSQTYPVSYSFESGTTTYSFDAHGGILTETAISNFTGNQGGTETDNVTSKYEILTGLDTVTVSSARAYPNDAFTASGSGSHVYVVTLTHNDNK